MRYLFTTIIFTFLLTAAVFTNGCIAFEIPASSEQIRIAIIKNVWSLNISGDGILATDESGRALDIRLPATFRAENGKISAGNRVCSKLRLASADRIKVNGKSYRGLVELQLQGGKLLAINQLPLEHYLVGLINSEISSSWPMESIKTQAVIARTFAVAKKRERAGAIYDLESTVMDQAYSGSDDEDSRAARGVHETDGEVLTYNGAVIQAFYHANSGGRTESSENVWGASIPYLKGVECRYGLTSSTRNWELAMPLARLENSLKSLKISGITDIRGGELNSRGRLKTVQLETSKGLVTLPATKFRMTVGSTVIRSTSFTVRVENGTAYFSGTGYGHGVGLCQYGAKQRALDGFKYNEILAYYYPGTRLMKLQDLR